MLLGAGWKHFFGIRETPPSDGQYEMEKDPVCGKFVFADAAVKRLIGAEARYYCSEDCASRDETGKSGA